MNRWGPEERHEYLRAIGVPRRVGMSAEERYRAGYPVEGDYRGPLADLEAIARTWHPTRGRYVRETLDVEASYRNQRIVTRSRVINAICPCGGEAVVPPITPNGEFVCDDCFASERAQRAAEEADRNLAARTAAAELAELAELWDGPGNYRPVFR